MPDFWLPLTAELLIDGDTARLKRPNGNFLDLLGRIRPGVNAKSLEAKLKVEFHAWLASHVADMEPGEKELWRQQTLHLIPGGGGVAAMRDQYADGLKLLLIASGCVLLVACANLANLMLARGLRDRAQMSIRVALGASPVRLVRKVLVESLLLAVGGGVLGIGVAYAATRLMLRLAFQTGGPNNYVPIQAAPSWPILNGVADPDYGRMFVSHGAFIIPTLTEMVNLCGLPDNAALGRDTRISSWLPQSEAKRLKQSVGKPKRHADCVGSFASIPLLVDAGAVILAGTDAGNPGVSYGASLHEELELLVRCGLSPKQALTSATSTPARIWRLQDRGRIAPGLRADLLLVNGDPTEDITATRNINRIWLAGVLVNRSQLQQTAMSLQPK